MSSIISLDMFSAAICGFVRGLVGVEGSWRTSDVMRSLLKLRSGWSPAAPAWSSSFGVRETGGEYGEELRRRACRILRTSEGLLVSIVLFPAFSESSNGLNASRELVISREDCALVKPERVLGLLDPLRRRDGDEDGEGDAEASRCDWEYGLDEKASCCDMMAVDVLVVMRWCRGEGK
ncbi:hypothetical protein IWZ00DRAFT_514499 [Phyllosticta capitalensis]